ncbi:hypothetical protein ACLB1O_31655 [Escherichia coli]
MQELRTYLQLAPFGLSDFRALVRELTELAQQTDKGLLLAGRPWRAYGRNDASCRR